MNIMRTLELSVEKELGRKVNDRERMTLRHISTMYEKEIRESLEEEAIEFASAVQHLEKQRNDDV